MLFLLQFFLTNFRSAFKKSKLSRYNELHPFLLYTLMYIVGFENVYSL